MLVQSQFVRVMLRLRGGFSAIPTSDTLFGALCWAYRSLFGMRALEELLDDFGEHEDSFLVSSCFPYLGQAQRLFFLPRPRSPIWTGGLGEYKDRAAAISRVEAVRRLDKAELVSEEVFRCWLGWLAKDGVFDARADEQLGSVHWGWIATAEEVPRCGTGPVTGARSEVRNAIDRMTWSTAGEGALFSVMRHYIDTRRGGIYFWLACRRPERLVPVVRLAVETGLGADRSSGAGAARVEFELARPAFPVQATEPTPFVLLSRYLPAADEVNWADGKTRYRLQTVRSMVEAREEFRGQRLWKKPVIYLLEGSVVVPKRLQPVYGRLQPWMAPVRQRNVRQYGLVFPAFVQGVQPNAAEG